MISKATLLRQQSIYHYAVPKTNIKSHERGFPKSTVDFDTPRESKLWGDPHLTGEAFSNKNWFRLYSHNVNGLSSLADNVDVKTFVENLQRKEVAVFGIQETNRNFAIPNMLSSFHNTIRNANTHHTGSVSSANIDWPTKYQPGGTAVSAMNHWATRVISKGSDIYGRWSWIIMVGKGTKKIVFLSGYRVCQGGTKGSLCSKTVRSQQEFMYASQGEPNVDLRKRFTSDLTRMVKTFQDQGHDLVLMLDANEASSENSSIDKMLWECNLVDAHTVSRETTSPPPTHQNGKSKIDFVLISSSLVSAVRAVSILPLHDGYLSDHRALVVDFDPLTLFEGKTTEIIMPVQRRLTSTNLLVVTKYMEFLLKYVAQHHILRRVQALKQTSDCGDWNEKSQSEWEMLDRLLLRGRQQAEGKCPEKRSGAFAWSPELSRAIKLLFFWRMKARNHTCSWQNKQQLQELAEELEIDPTERDSKSRKLTYDRIRIARSMLKDLKKRAKINRDQYLDESAKLVAALQNMNDDSSLRAIQQREKSSRQFGRIRQVFQSNKASGFDRLDVPDKYAVLQDKEEIPRLTLVVKEEIEAILVPHTIDRFRQHEETPFGRGERKRRMGYDCRSTDFEQAMHGTYDYDLEKLSDEAREWLMALKTKPFVETNGTIDVSVSMEEWIAGWSKMRESTASAPGAGHYGHYKTVSVCARLPEKHPQHSKTLAAIYAAMLSLPLKHGFSPTRWQYCVDAIIEKIPNKPRIEKLRIIMLYEADFNFLLKLVWGKRLVRNAEAHKSIGESSHGSRSGRQAQDALLQKLLIYENARLSRTSLLTADNDAKGCFDRMIRTLAMLGCTAVGLPKNAAISHNLTHALMNHGIKTRHGCFQPYTGTEDSKLEGTGQGSGASPAIWLLYCDSLLQAFQKFTRGILISRPFDNQTRTVPAIFYVDDGTPGVNDILSESPIALEELLSEGQQVAQSWERLLFASGGALELSKCFVYLMYWDLSNGYHRLIEPNEIAGCCSSGDKFIGPVALTYGDNKIPNIIETESPKTGRRTLGVRIAPAGNWEDEFKFRRQQARTLAQQLNNATISKETAAIAYRMVICPKLEYPLGITQFTQAQCDKITAPIISAVLASLGYNRNMPRTVVYGPNRLGGIGIHDMYIEQGIRQIMLLVGHVRQESETSFLIEASIQWCHIQAGSEFHLLEHPEFAVDYIENCWIMCIRDFLRTFGLSMSFTRKALQQKQCENDEFIMDAFRTRGECSALELQKLNACRMYLQVSRLSEVSTGDGKQLQKNIVCGLRSELFKSRNKWPRQGKPLGECWKLWKRKLLFTFSKDCRTNNLREPLQSWFPDRINIQEWSTLLLDQDDSATKQALIYTRSSATSYEVRAITQARRGSITIGQVEETHVLSPNKYAIPIEIEGTVQHRVRKIRIWSRKPIKKVLPSRVSLTRVVSQNRCFEVYFSRQAPHIREILQFCDISENVVYNFAELIHSSKNLVSGSDGGLLVQQGTFGFVWGNQSDGSIIAAGRGVVDSCAGILSSTRTELVGIFASLTYIRLVMECFNVAPPPQCKVTLYCDSTAAINRVKDSELDYYGSSWRCRENYDVEAAIRSCMQLLPFSVKVKWIRGHALRRKKEWHKLTWPETLNELADEEATKAREIPSFLSEQHWPEQHVSVQCTEGSFIGKLSGTIRDHCTAPGIIRFWKQKYKWSNSVSSSLDLVGLKSVTQQHSVAATRRARKLRNGWLPVNQRVALCNQDHSSSCLSCSNSQLTVETIDHLFWCSAPERITIVVNRISNLLTDFGKWKTDASVSAAVLTGVKAWLSQVSIPSVQSLDLPDTQVGKFVEKAYHEQGLIGWNLLFRGFWSKSWRLAQETALIEVPNRSFTDNGESWARLVQKWFFDLFEEVWSLRNVVQHGRDITAQEEIRHKQLSITVRRLYRQGSKLPFTERLPFQEDLESLLSRPARDLEHWVNLTTSFLPNAYRRVSNSISNQTSLDVFFKSSHADTPTLQVNEPGSAQDKENNVPRRPRRKRTSSDLEPD